MLLVDAHVHIHDCFHLERYFTSAYRNFEVEAGRFGAQNDFTGILLLAETSGVHWFDHLSDCAQGRELPGCRKSGEWSFHGTDDECCLEVRSGEKKKLFLVAGRQVVTAEGLEVLALVTAGYWEDGLSTEETIRSILEKDAIPVIPWGFGKWTRRKGRVLDKILARERIGRVFLGDNGGRANFLAEPCHFKKAFEKGIKILPGSDPLPFSYEERRAGSFGFFFYEPLSTTHPARAIVRNLQNPEVEIHPYGRLEKPLPFLFKQVAMQIRKRAGKK